MKQKTLKTVEEIHSILKGFRKSTRTKFRGQSDAKWKLIPKAGRPAYKTFDDAELFRHWKRRAKTYLDKEIYSEWELLSIAQHTGLSTRLLDWTHNPLVGLFFACIEGEKTDGAIYMYTPSMYIDSTKVQPFDTKNTIDYYQPSSSSQRISNQLGHFTIHSPATLELDDNISGIKIERLIIKSNQKKEIVFMLNQYGINYLTLFPDLEGLSKHLCWFSENNSYWRSIV